MQHNNNWLLAECATRITDNRAQWRDDFEEHLRNTAEAAAEAYYKNAPQKIDYSFGMLWQAIAFAVFLFISLYIVAIFLNQH
jgi:hypothetical protein